MSVNIVLDSVAPSKIRVTTFELVYPRYVHAELLTHRVFSRNAASSRAIPITKFIEDVQNNPVIPVRWGLNQPGMQAVHELAVDLQDKAKTCWLQARDNAIKSVLELQTLGVHKQICNRLLEPWFFIRTIVTATTFDNFFALRNHRDAQEDLQYMARDMVQLYAHHSPTALKYKDWHCPYILPEENEAIMRSYGLDGKLKISTARCARVSYLNHDGTREYAKDIALFNRLIGAGKPDSEPPHSSPLEHVAMALKTPRQSGNFIGWQQYRKVVERNLSHYRMQSA